MRGIGRRTNIGYRGVIGCGVYIGGRGNAGRGDIGGRDIDAKGDIQVVQDVQVLEI